MTSEKPLAKLTTDFKREAKPSCKYKEMELKKFCAVTCTSTGKLLTILAIPCSIVKSEPPLGFEARNIVAKLESSQKMYPNNKINGITTNIIAKIMDIEGYFNLVCNLPATGLIP